MEIKLSNKNELELDKYTYHFAKDCIIKFKTSKKY